MSDETNRFNGWSNHATWCVHLWLTNEEGDYRYWREEAARHRKEARSCEQVQSGTWTAEQAERFNLADQLKSELEEASPLEEASLFSDLLTSVLSEVDWHEVAEAFLQEVEPDRDPKDGENDQADLDDEEDNSAEEFERVRQERIESTTGPLFELGQLVSTPGALTALSREDIGKALARHHRGDWGDVGPADWRENNLSLREGFRLLSSYESESGEKFWIITEADRSATTVLLPAEY